MAIVGATMQIAFWSIIIPVAILVMRFLFSEIFYIIGILFFGVIDILQSVFRKLAGLDVVYYGSKAVNGDILTSILRSQIVMDTMIAVAVFAIALVIIATIVQMIRTEYTTEGSKNSKESIFAKGLKSLVMFILIPVVCFFGIRVSNYLLQAIDYATSSTGSRSLSGAVFAASVVDANRISANMEGEFSITDITITNLLVSLFAGDKQSAHMGSEGGRVFVKGFKETLSVTDTGNASKNRSNLGKKIDELMTMPSDSAKTANSGGYGDGIFVTGKLNYMNITAVSFFYAFSKMNFLIMYVGAFMVLQALFNASMGMVVRMYKVTALFILAPAAIGLQPLDDGAAYKKWRTGFISNVLSAYGVIIALNLFFAIAGVVSGISLWDPENPIYYTLNKFMQALFVVVGATQIKGLAKMIGDMIGAANAMEEGQAAVGEVGKLAASAGKFAGGVAKGGAYFSAKGKAMAGRVAAARTRGQIKKLDAGVKSGAIDEDASKARRAELTEKLDKQEAFRQINAGRASGLLADSGIGKTFGSLTGGVKGIIDNTAYKGYDAATVESMKKKGGEALGKAGESMVKDYQARGANRVDNVRNFAVTGGLSGVGTALGAAVGGVHGIVSAAKAQKGERGKAFKESFTKDFNAVNTASTALIDGGMTIGGKTNESISKFNHEKIDAQNQRDEQTKIARAGVDSQISSTVNAAEKKGGAVYTSRKNLAASHLSSIRDDNDATTGFGKDFRDMQLHVNDLVASSIAGSSIRQLADQLKTIVDGIVAHGGPATDEEASAVDRILNSAKNDDFMAKEYGATSGLTEQAMKDFFQQKVDIDSADITAKKAVEKADDSKGVNKAISDLTKALQEYREKGDQKTQDNLADLLAKGITVRGTDGEPLKVDSKQFVDAIKDLKSSVEAQNMASVQKDTLKTMQDMLKELKKKK